jgi:hypothetical protein
LSVGIVWLLIAYLAFWAEAGGGGEGAVLTGERCFFEIDAGGGRWGVGGEVEGGFLGLGVVSEVVGGRKEEEGFTCALGK